MSGLNQQFTKLSALHRAREFESHILRLRSLRSLRRTSPADHFDYSPSVWFTAMILV